MFLVECTTWCVHFHTSIHPTRHRFSGCCCRMCHFSLLFFCYCISMLFYRCSKKLRCVLFMCLPVTTPKIVLLAQMHSLNYFFVSYRSRYRAAIRPTNLCLLWNTVFEDRKGPIFYIEWLNITLWCTTYIRACGVCDRRSMPLFYLSFQISLLENVI